ncbi:MAG: zinc ABC transporter substrate-binding protein, partial [Deltaproteobacteria bacterium]|nr:zinc ABC transporter substrate-binding protein [Deltaproteobacteria bacterium]
MEGGGRKSMKNQEVDMYHQGKAHPPVWAAALLAIAASLLASSPAARVEGKKLRVVTTYSSYASIVEYIGREHVEVSYIVKGNQDPHIVRPKPSLALQLNNTDLLVDTGLDLEMWVPSLQDMAGNPRIMSGQPGYVSVSTGLSVVEKPTSLDRSEGDVHVFGNPHIHTSPLNGKVIAENIAIALRRLLPAHGLLFEANLKKFKEEIDRRVFGEELVKILGSATLCRLAEKGQLHGFLAGKTYQGRPLLERLGGWLKQAEPLRGKKMINYHKNWPYFTQLFGLEVVGYVEPKPGIPPSPGHIARLIEAMKREDVKVLFDANYFEQESMQLVASKTGAVPVIVGLAVGGQEGMNDF